MGKKEKYEEYIMESIRQNLDLEKDDTSRDREIMEMSRREIFERYLTWEGIIGYGDRFLDTVEDIYGVWLDD